jgi:hypothetical protein
MTRMQQEATYPAYPSLRITVGTPGEKTQIPNYWGTRDKNLNEKQLQLHKSQNRVKYQENHSPSKASATTKDLNT